MKTMLKKMRKGFTLLEVIIVIIIIGVLAALAIPNLIKNVDRAKAQEAFEFMLALRGSVERCYAANSGSLKDCEKSANLDVYIPNTAAVTGKFAYGIYDNNGADLDTNATGYKIIANYGAGVTSGTPSTDSCALTVSAFTTTPSVTKTCIGKFSGL